MRILILTLLLPTLLFAQDFTFELQPEAFPVDIDGWQPQCPWSGGLDSSTPEFCDIDADGDLDLFSGEFYNYYWFFQNTGTALEADFDYVTSTFELINPVAPTDGYRADIDFCDIDADGYLDAFLSNECISLIINNGTASQWDFSTPPDTLFDQFGDYLWARNMAATDIDADGDVDLFGGTAGTGELIFYENQGTPEEPDFYLMSSSWQGISASGGSSDPCFADLDADGDLDLLMGTYYGNICYYSNEGDSITPNMVLQTTTFLNIDVEWYSSPELADVDGDADLDLFVGRGFGTNEPQQNGNIAYYENIGNPQNADFIYRTDNYLIFDSGNYSRPILVDIDADNDPDLVTQIADRLALYRNTGSSESPAFTFESYDFAGIEVADPTPWFTDIDFDGDYDLITGESAIPGPPGLHLYLNRGTPQTPEFVLYSDDLLPGIFTQNSVILNPTMIDIDADGDEDLFVSTNQATLYYFENNSTPNQIEFDFITDNWQGIIDPPPGGSHMYCCFYDIDGDQDYDLFTSDNAYYWELWDKNLVFYRNIGTPQNADMVLENDDVFPDIIIFQAAPFVFDMDMDGDGDLLLGDSFGGIRYFENIYDSSAVGPRTRFHNYPVMDFTIGPNPANPITWISYNLPYPQKAEIAVYNLLGQKVATLASGLQMPGERSVAWNTGNTPSGIYFIRFDSSIYDWTGRIVVAK